MENPIFNPPLPYSGQIFGGKFDPGKMVLVQGTIPSAAYRFDIKLQCGPDVVPPHDIAIQVSVRILEGHILLNSLKNCIWGEEVRKDAIPINRAEEFEIAVVCDFNQYKVMINGQHYCNFPQRIRHDHITHLAIHGDVSIFKISYEPAPEDAVGILSGNNVSDVDSIVFTPLLAPAVQENELNGILSSQGRHISSPPGYSPPPSYESSNQADFVAPQPRPSTNAFSTGATSIPPYPTNTPYHTSTPYPYTGQPEIAAPYETNRVGNMSTSPYSPSGAPYLPPPPGAPAPLNLPQPSPGAPVPLNAFAPLVAFQRVKQNTTPLMMRCVIIVCGTIASIVIVTLVAYLDGFKTKSKHP